MNSLITVVIEKTDNIELLKRSIKSIYRQSYNNIEIRCVGDISQFEFSKINTYFHNTLGEAIRSASGEFIFFMDYDTVVSPSAIVRLVNEISDKQCCLIAATRYSVMEKKVVTFNLNVNSLSGILFKSEYLKNCDFVSAYSDINYRFFVMNLPDDIYVSKFAYVYISKSNFDLKSYFLGLSNIEKSLFINRLDRNRSTALINTFISKLNIDELATFIEYLSYSISEKKITYDEIMDIYYGVVKNGLNAVLSIENNSNDVNKEIFNSLKNIILAGKSSSRYKYDLDSLNLNEDCIDAMSNCDYYAYFRWYKNYENKDHISKSDVTEIANGYELSIQFVEYFKCGKLGGRTILKAFRALVCYKLKRIGAK